MQPPDIGLSVDQDLELIGRQPADLDVGHDLIWVKRSRAQAVVNDVMPDLEHQQAADQSNPVYGHDGSRRHRYGGFVFCIHFLDRHV